MNLVHAKRPAVLLGMKIRVRLLCRRYCISMVRFMFSSRPENWGVQLVESWNEWEMPSSDKGAESD